MRYVLSVWMILLTSTAVAAEEPVTFTRGPVVTGAAVEFTVSRLADVAVYVLDAKGRTVRHLVAGQLGANAPAPLKPESLAQKLTWDGLDDAGRKAAGGPFAFRVAVDGKGNVYVADRGNNRVAVFSPAGKHLGDIPFELPACVEVHPKTGAVYVLGGAKYIHLAKFASFQADTPATTATLPYYRNRHFRATMALDASGEKPVLWLGCLLRAYGLLRIEDEGKTFGKRRDVIPRPKKRTGVGRVFDVSYDRRSDTLLIMTDKAFASRHRTVANASTNTTFKDAQLQLGGVGYLGTGSIGLDGLAYRFLYHRHNRRVVRVRIAYEADATVKAK